MCPDSLNNTLVGSPSLSLPAGPGQWQEGRDTDPGTEQAVGTRPRAQARRPRAQARLLRCPRGSLRTGSLPQCGVPGRCHLRTGAVAEGPSLLVPDRTSSQLSCRLLATQWGFRMNWQRQAHSTCSPRPPGGGYKCRLKRSKAERWSQNGEGAHRCRAWESG